MNNIKLQQDLCNVIRQAIDQKDIMGANLLITKLVCRKRMPVHLPLQENCAMYALVIYYKNQINYKFEF